MASDAPNPLCHLPHFVTGEYTRNKTFLGDDEYGRALDCFVKGCADLLLTDDRGMMLMGKRKVHPQPDWWVLGGRMKAGDTVEEAAGRNCRRETGIDIAPERWSFVCCQTMLWQFRKQAPEGNGTADFGVIMTARITAEERASMNMCSEEYESFGWFVPEDLIKPDAQLKLHPVLFRGVKELVAKKTKDALHAAVLADAPDAEIAALVRTLYR
jgi:isopentenyldiphosphate isomerase